MDLDGLIRIVLIGGGSVFAVILYSRAKGRAENLRTSLETPTEWDPEWREGQLIVAESEQRRASEALERSTGYANDQVVRAERIAVFIPTVWGLLLGLALSSVKDLKLEQVALETIVAALVVFFFAVESTYEAFGVLFGEEQEELQPWDIATLDGGGSLELAIFKARMVD